MIEYYTRDKVQSLLCALMGAVGSGMHRGQFNGQPYDGCCIECIKSQPQAWRYSNSGHAIGWIRDAILEKAKQDGVAIDWNIMADQIDNLPSYPKTKTYRVEITYTAVQVVEVEATDEEEAESLADMEADYHSAVEDVESPKIEVEEI